MKIKVIKFDGEGTEYDVVSFEFRTNQVSNWIRLKYEDGTDKLIHGVATIQST